MSTEVVRSSTPEEEELSRKRAELTQLETELAESELELATLARKMHAFEQQYLRTIGVRYAVLDELLAQIAERKAQAADDPRTWREAEKARGRARESAETAGAAREELPSAAFEPSESLKKLYRELAKKIHPDLADNAEDRSLRTRLMAEVNRAYEDGDEARLVTILREWEARPEAVVGEGPGAELVRAIRKIAQVRLRLDVIRSDMERLKSSDLYTLMAKAEEAEAEGGDFLASMAVALDAEIQSAREELNRISRLRNS